MLRCRSSTWWASMCATPLLCSQEALVHHLAEDCSAATSSALPWSSACYAGQPLRMLCFSA